MALIIFLRHGQAQNNVEKILAGRDSDFDLTQTGVEQAQSAARLLEPLGISRIYASPVRRARHTADIVAERIPAEVTTDDRLTELDMGSFTGMRYDDLAPEYKAIFERYYFGTAAADGMETFSEVKRRIAGMTDHIVRCHSSETVLLVTHMDPVKAALSNISGMPPQLLSRLVIANASLNVFGQHKGSVYLMGFNVMSPERFHQTW